MYLFPIFPIGFQKEWGYGVNDTNFKANKVKFNNIGANVNFSKHKINGQEWMAKFDDKYEIELQYRK